MFVSEDPPLLAVNVAEHLLTHDLIEQVGEFVINVALLGQLEIVKELGSTHGRDVDKFDHFAHVVDKEKDPLVWHQGHYFALGMPKSI